MNGGRIARAKRSSGSGAGINNRIDGLPAVHDRALRLLAEMSHRLLKFMAALLWLRSVRLRGD